MKVIIKPLVGDGFPYKIDVEPTTTVRELKRLLQAETDFDEETFAKMSLCFNGELLFNDKETLEYYEVKDRSQLVLADFHDCTRDFEGFGLKFTNVADRKGLKRFKFAKTAPPWRIAASGLCLEGVCKTPSCDAFKQQVIIPIGFRKYDLLNEADEDVSQCPICHKYVEPITCAFSNCRWKYEGRKAEEGQPPKRFSCDWQIADDAYHYFEDTKSLVVWRNLVIETERYKPIR